MWPNSNSVNVIMRRRREFYILNCSNTVLTAIVIFVLIGEWECFFYLQDLFAAEIAAGRKPSFLKLIAMNDVQASGDENSIKNQFSRCQRSARNTNGTVCESDWTIWYYRNACDSAKRHRDGWREYNYASYARPPTNDDDDIFDRNTTFNTLTTESILCCNGYKWSTHHGAEWNHGRFVQQHERNLRQHKV